MGLLGSMPPPLAMSGGGGGNHAVSHMRCLAFSWASYSPPETWRCTHVGITRSLYEEATPHIAHMVGGCPSWPLCVYVSADGRATGRREEGRTAHAQGEQPAEILCSARSQYIEAVGVGVFSLSLLEDLGGQVLLEAS